MANLKKLVKANCHILKDSSMTFEDIYNIVFSHKDNILAEYSQGNGPESITYKQAEKCIEKLANAVFETAGAGAYIGLYAPNCPQWIMLFWAILKSGNKPCLINLRQPTAFSKGILDTLDAQLVLCCGECPDFGIRALEFSELLQIGGEAHKVSTVPFGNHFAISTNGTTLKQKICIYSGKEVSNQILNIRTMQEENAGFVETCKGKIKMLCFLPLYHIFGLEAMYLWYAFWGSTFVFLRDMNPDNILYTIRRYEVTHIFAVPLLWNAVEKSLMRNISSRDEKTQKKFKFATELSLKLQGLCPKLGKWVASQLLKDVRRRLFGDSVRFCISGGSAIKESALKLINSLGYELYNGYGMSEIGITSVELTKKVRERIEGSIGKPFDSVEYKIGEDSKLFVKGSSICEKVIIDGEEQPCEDWFDTGDVVYRNDRGCYHISGRISDVVFGADGENLNPDFAEDAFALSDALALSVLGNGDNSRLMLVVQIPADLLGMQKEHLLCEIEKCNATLSQSYQVREFYYTCDPIMDAMAIKVSRPYLKKAIAEGRVALHSFDEKITDPQQDEGSEIKIILRELFCKVLSKAPEEISDAGHFMNDLGGTSLDYFTLISEIDKRFGVTLGFESQQFGYCVNDFERIIKEMIN